MEMLVMVAEQVLKQSHQLRDLTWTGGKTKPMPTIFPVLKFSVHFPPPDYLLNLRILSLWVLIRPFFGRRRTGYLGEPYLFCLDEPGESIAGMKRDPIPGVAFTDFKTSDDVLVTEAFE